LEFPSSSASKECIVTARLFKLVAFAVLISASSVSSAGAQGDYTLFESGHVRPMAMSPDGYWLYVCNTPDAILEINVLSPSGGGKIYSVPVGLEPVAVAARNNSEVWVVNHLSDSVSIVNTAQDPPRVVRTLHVGDEPRDIVFASGKAFITTAHRGQNTPWPDGDYDTPGIGRADVWVFDAANPGAGMGGTPITVINLFGDKPRALAASPDGTRVYAAVFRSGNRTAAVSEGLVCDGGSSCTVQSTLYPAGRPDPETNFQGGTCNGQSSNPGASCTSDADCPGGACVGSGKSRESSIIVGYDEGSGLWLDELNNDWSPAVPFGLPDYDVFEIDAVAATPVQLGTLSGSIVEGVPGVGAILFNMIVNPADGDLYVTNTDANNRVRFEGLGDYESIIGPKSSGDPASVRGEIAKARITVLDASGDSVVTPHTEFSVIPQQLNTHIPYRTMPVPAGVKEKSIATPMEMAISSDGTTLYVAGFGSSSVHIYDTTELKNGTFTPNTADIIPLPVSLPLGITGGASGLVLDEPRGRLYVASRTTTETYIFDVATKALVKTLRPHNPEPPEVTDGRPFLYDAKLTGSNGEASCSSCHIFGDMDDLSWDLGDPDAVSVANNNPKPQQDPTHAPNINALPNALPFDALKGPMTTQSLRGMVNAGPMHWRGDRTGPACEAGIDVNQDPTCETQAFDAFNVAFPGLVGRDEGQLTTGDMDAFTAFALRLTYPPNPIRALDNSLTPQQDAGRLLYSGRITDIVANCNGCHRLDRAAGFFGTSGGTTFENETMEFKVPHLRNAYQKVGMFGQMPSDFFTSPPGTYMGPQVRGTGFLHDGSVDTVFDFLGADVFDAVQPPLQPVGLSEPEQRDLEAFIMAFDSDLAPIVGQQVTLTQTCIGGPNDGGVCVSDADCPGGACNGTNLTEVEPRIDLLIERSSTLFPETGQPECDLIVKGVIGSDPRGWLKLTSGTCIGGSNDGASCVLDADCPSGACDYDTVSFLSDTRAEGTWTKADLIAVAAVPGQALTFTCVPSANGGRMAFDRDRDALWDFDDPYPDFYNSLQCNIGRTTPAGSVASVLFLMVLGAFARRLTIGRRRRRLS
jgi:DNA-binding beta-propeller fold protein YncE